MVAKQVVTPAPTLGGAFFARLGYVALQGVVVLGLLVFGALGIERAVS